MARSPTVPTELAPFAEGTPLDDLQVEEIDNDEVLIGDPEMDVMQNEDSDFDSNLAEVIDDNELAR